MKVSKIRIIIIVLSVIGFFVFSSSSSHKPETHIAFLFDRTDSTSIQDVDRIANFLFSLAKIDTVKGNWGEVKVTLSIIGETSTQRALVVYLTPSEAYWSRNEMEHQLRGRKFYIELKRALQEITKPGFGMSNSYINRNTFYQLSSLANKKGDRFCITYSNLIENGPHVRLYDYRDNPHKITTMQDSLFQVLSTDYPLPDLTGIQLVNVHKSNRPDDELHEVCKRFFKAYWERYGAKVELLTDTPQI